MLTKKKIADNIWAVYSDSQIEIGKAFIRFQEYYENTVFKGSKNFSVRDIEYWWMQNKTEDQASYYEEWVGFNLPGRVLVELAISSTFRSGFSVKQFFRDPTNYPRWHHEEDELLDLLSDLPTEELVGSYIIGIWKGSTDTFDHELAHGLYSTNGVYKAEQIYNLSQLPKDIYDRIRNDLIDCGYHRDVVHDEIQAYLSSYVDSLEDMFETTDYNAYTTPFEKTLKKFTPPL